MTTSDRDRRLAEWARKQVEHHPTRVRSSVLADVMTWHKCETCGGPTVGGTICPSCWQYIAECVEKGNRDDTR